MSKQNERQSQSQGGCRCAEAVCGCATVAAVRCTCGQSCDCQRTCRCGGGCGCAAKK